MYGCDECGYGPDDIRACEGIMCSDKGCACVVREYGSCICEPNAILCAECAGPQYGCRMCS